MRALLWATASLLLLAGCGLPTGDTIPYSADSPELANASVSAEGIWESSPWSDAPWLPYPPQATIEVEHTLARVPRVVDVYISFDPDGFEPAPAAGDLARIITADEMVVGVRNDTESVLFARITAY